MSPYLFMLVMQVLSHIISRRIRKNESFRFHCKCATHEISHLSFADDLFLFCHGDHGFVQVLKDGLSEFAEVSSLEPNLQKSSYFLCHVKQEYRVFLRVLCFQEDHLPVRNLGFLLVLSIVIVQLLLKKWKRGCIP